MKEGLYSIEDLVLQINLPEGSENALLAKVSASMEALNSGDTLTAKTSLEDLINQLSAPGFSKKYLPGGSGSIIPEVELIIGLL